MRRGGAPSDILLPPRVKNDFHFIGERTLLALLLDGSSITVWYFSGKQEGPPPKISKDKFNLFTLIKIKHLFKLDI